MKNYSDELINEGKLSELEDISIETSKPRKQREKGLEKNKIKQKQTHKTEHSIQELWDNYKMYNIHIMGILEGEKRERNRRNIWSINKWEAPQIYVRHQTTDPGSPEDTK